MRPETAFDVSNVTIDQGACIALTSPATACGLCRDRCPTGAIAITEASIDLDAGNCVLCGQCAAACPTEAIAAPGFEALEEDAAAGTESPAIFECARTRARDRQPGARAVPCLGGLSATALLNAAARQVQDIVLVDRGWCEACPAGGGTAAPWRDEVEKADRVLADLGRRALRVLRSPLPAERARPLPERLERRGAARRRLLRDLATAPSGLRAAARRAPGRAHAKIAPRASLARHRAISDLAARQGQPVAARHYPSVTLSDACCDSRVCVAVCPTGALTQSQEGVIEALLFQAARCVACGACERACPSGALSLVPAGSGRLEEERELRRAPIHRCPLCGAQFRSGAATDVCPSCRADSELAREAFQLVRTTAAGPS